MYFKFSYIIISEFILLLLFIHILHDTFSIKYIVLTANLVLTLKKYLTFVYLKKNLVLICLPYVSNYPLYPCMCSLTFFDVKYLVVFCCMHFKPLFHSFFPFL